MMFKVLVIANLYNLSHLQLEFPTTDRLRFKPFLGLSAADQSPDEKTFLAFHETLTLHGLIGPLFAIFHAWLHSAGMSARKGQIVDASFVKVPRQRNSRGDNATTNAGEVPANWEDQPEKARQKDNDARWTSKNGERHYGYKNHVQAKPIERAYRNKPLKARQQRNNWARSRTRVRAEHVFATIRMSLRASWNRCSGITRNCAAIARTNLSYNLVRFEQIVRLNLKNWRTA